MTQVKDDSILAHTKWTYKYYIVFTPKYRRKIIYGELRQDVGKIIRRLCELKYVEILEMHAIPGDIYMLVKIPPSTNQTNTLEIIGQSRVLA